MSEGSLLGTGPSDGEASGTARSAPRRGLWLWFMAGFLLAFAGLLLFFQTGSMHPSGRSVTACPLWQFYLLELQRASSGSLGPATGSSSALVTTAVQHLLLSAVGGAVVLVIGWAARKSNVRPIVQE